MRCDTLVATGWPFLVAGVNRNRRWARLQAVLSSEPLPLEEETLHPVTRPLAPTCMLMTVVPCASARIAAAG